MFENAAGTGKAIVPTMPYRNVAAMVDWLCDVYGFERQLIVKGENGEVEHAQLAFGASMILVTQVRDATLERLVIHPDQIGGVETQTCYLVVADVDAHYARARAKGAEIIFGIGVRDRRGRGYASRDPEGHIWMFGTYDPWENRHRDAIVARPRRRLGLGVPLLASALLVLMVSITAAVWTASDRLAALGAEVLRFARQESVRRGAERDASALETELIEARTAKESAERGATDLATQLAQTRAALETALQNEKEARALLAQEVRMREGLGRAAQQAEDQLGEERTAKQVAERAAREARDQLERERYAKATLERVARETTEKCEVERRTRSLAERSAQDATAELARERSARVAAELAASELRNQLMTLGTAPQGVRELQERIEAERRAKEKFEHAAKNAELQLAQERYSRDASERALRQAQDRLATSSCWACPTGAPCARPQ